MFEDTNLPTHQVTMSTTQTVLPFKLATTNESLTAHAGLAVFGEFIGALGLSHLIDEVLPEPGMPG